MPLQFGSVSQLPQVATPTAPPAGSTLLYTKSDGNIYKMASTGGEVLVGPGAGGPPTGTATGDLSGTYPGPLVVASSASTFVANNNAQINGTLNMNPATGSVINSNGGNINTNGGALQTGGGNVNTQGGALNGNPTIFLTSPNMTQMQIGGASNIQARIQTGSAGASLIFQVNAIYCGTYNANPASPGAGNTSGFYANDVHGFGGLFSEDMSGGGTTGATVNNNGRIIRTSSVEDLKENIQPLSLATAKKSLGLQAVTFDWRDKEAMGTETHPGFLVEQAVTVDELWISRDADGKPETFRYMELTSAHQVLLQDMTAKIAALEARIAALEGKPGGKPA